MSDHEFSKDPAAKFLQSLIKSTCQTFRMQLSTQVSFKDVDWEGRHPPDVDTLGFLHVILQSHVIWLGIYFNSGVLLSILNRSLGENYQDLPSELSSSPGELLNIVASGMKNDMADPESPTQSFHNTNPMTISGSNISANQDNEDSKITLRFDVPEGFFYVGVNLNGIWKRGQGPIEGDFTQKLGAVSLDTTVLLVDDIVSSRKLTMKFCKDLGFSNFIETEDGTRAWEAVNARHEEIGMILCDFRMPNFDGFEFMKKLKMHTRYHHIPVILISSECSKVEILQATKLGVKGILQKPFSREKLELKIKEIQKS